MIIFIQILLTKRKTMKKIPPWFALLAVVLWAGCGSDEKSPTPEIKAVLSTDGLDVVVGDGDFEKTITVTLSHNAPTDAVFAVALLSEGGGETADPNITVPKGEKTGTAKIRFLKKAYPFEAATGRAAVSVSTSTPGITTAEAGSLLFNIRGTGPVTGPVAQLDRSDDIARVPTMGDIQYNFVINLSEPLDKEAVFHVTAACDVADGYFGLSETVTINKGNIQGFGDISFGSDKYPYDTNKAKVRLTISSEDVFVLPGGSKMRLRVSGAMVDPDKEEMRYLLQPSYDAYVGSTGATRLAIEVSPEEFGKKNTKEHTIDAFITGGVEGIDYAWDVELPVTIPANTGQTTLYVNIFPAAAGRKLTLYLSSDEATLGSQDMSAINVIRE